MYYAIIAEDVENSLELRKQVRPEHLARVQVLVDAGRILAAGPHPAVDAEDPGEAGFTGSLIIADFASQAEAELWAAEDPYTTNGIFRQVTVKPFKLVMP
ncbi:MAG: YciI family protein [Pseudomonadota bacterium]